MRNQVGDPRHKNIYTRVYESRGGYYNDGALIIDIFLEWEQSFQGTRAGFLESFGVE